MEGLAEQLGKFLHDCCLSSARLANEQHGLAKTRTLAYLFEGAHRSSSIYELARGLLLNLSHII